MKTLSGLFAHVESIATSSNPPRLSRGQFILSSGLIAVCVVVALLILHIIAKFVGGLWLYSIGSLLVGLVSLYLGIKNGVRRCHDLGWTGHYCWLLIIPVINLILLAFLIFKPGISGKNKYGEDTVPSQEKSDEQYWILGIIFFVLYLIVSFANARFAKGTMQNYGDNMMKQGIWGDMIKQAIQEDMEGGSAADTVDVAPNDNTDLDIAPAGGDESASDTPANLDDVSFGIKACDDYVALLKCVIEKAPGSLKATYEQGFTQMVQIIKSAQGSYLEQVCQGIMDDVQSQKADFAQYGCELP